MIPCFVCLIIGKDLLVICSLSNIGLKSKCSKNVSLIEKVNAQDEQGSILVDKLVLDIL